MKVLKNVDYYKLVTLISKNANYSKHKATILYDYTSYMLLKNNFDVLYIDKLALDLNLIDQDDGNVNSHEYFKLSYKENMKSMNELFTKYEIITIKTIIWDIMHKCYHE